LDKNVLTLSGARIELPPRRNYCRRGTKREGRPELLADLMGEAAGSSRISVARGRYGIASARNPYLQSNQEACGTWASKEILNADIHV